MERLISFGIFDRKENKFIDYVKEIGIITFRSFRNYLDLDIFILFGQENIKIV